MSPNITLVLLALGAGAIALWIDIRFPRLRPDELRRALVHVGISTVVAHLVVPAVMRALLGLDSPIAVLVAIFAIAFPALTYSLLTALWLIGNLQRTLRGATR